MRQTYVSPAVVEYGSIADCTFVTPAVAMKQNIPVGNMPAIPGQDGSYYCSDLAGVYAGQGGKNYLVLQCDKFGEYSHGDGAGS